MLPVLLTIASLLFLSARPAEQEHPDVIVLDQGKVLRGEIIEVTDDELIFRYEEDGSEVTAGFNRAQLSPSSWYFATRERAETADEHLELARYCIDHSFYRLAEIELKRALELDPKMEEEVNRELTRAQRGAAEATLATAELFLRNGDYAQARRECARVLTGYEDASVRTQARELFDRIEAAQARPETARAAEAERGSESAGEGRESRRTVAPDPRLIELRDRIEPLRERARELDRAGLLSDSSNRSERAFRGAIGAYHKALQYVEKAIEETQDEGRLRSQLQQIRRSLISQSIDSYINLGSRELVTGSYVSALEYANRALALDSTSQHARSFRARVENAAAESGSFRRGGGRR